MNAQLDKNLLLAIAYKDLPEAIKSLNEGANVNAIADENIDGEYVEKGFSALMSASAANNGTAMRLLIDRGADINYCDTTSALHIEAFYTRDLNVEFLLNSGANVNLTDNRGQTPLLLICKNYSIGHQSTIDVLIQYGADVNIPDHQGSTPLMALLESEDFDNDLACVQQLLDSKADLTVMDKQGNTVFSIAEQLNLIKTLAFMTAYQESQLLMSNVKDDQDLAQHFKI